MQILFDLERVYYLPQYLPVYRELVQRGVDASIVVRGSRSKREAMVRAVVREGLSHVVCADTAAANAYIREVRPEWVVYGHALPEGAAHPKGTRTALLFHGIGVKDAYYDPALALLDLRFVEGPFRMQELKRRYPESRFEGVGFAKLDPLFGPTEKRPEFDLAAAGLTPGRTTLLYAPTFFPSSIECLSDDWPRQFEDYNLIVKPHSITFTNPRYKKQRQKLARWNEAHNVFVSGPEEYSLLPYMAVADLLLSEASSALFEFAALDKPVVWCDFVKLRPTYWGPLRYRLRKRMDPTIAPYADVGAHALTAGELKRVVDGQRDRPEEFAARRRECTADLVGFTDGKASERVADHLLKNGV